MQLKLLVVGGVSLALSLTAGCASNSNFLSAKPAEKGKIQLYTGLSSISIADTSSIIPSGFLFEVGADAGLTERFSLGFKYSFLTSGALNAKYTFIQTDSAKGFFSAIGLRGGYTAFPSVDSADANNRVEIAVPLYTSFYPTPWLGISVIPTYSLRFFTNEGSALRNLAGANVNLALGKKLGVVVEGSYFWNFGFDYQEVQVGACFFYGLDRLF
jgi:hypothetical protein